MKHPKWLQRLANKQNKEVDNVIGSKHSRQKRKVKDWWQKRKKARRVAKMSRRQNR